MSTALALRGATGLQKILGPNNTSLVRTGMSKASGWLGKLKGVNPTALKVGAVGAAGAYGYSSGGGTTGQRLERGLGFAAATGLGVSSRFRAGATHQSKVMGRAISRFGTKGGTAMMAGRAFSGARGVGVGAAVGGMYGAFDSDTSIISGAAMGAGGVALGRGAARGIAAGNKLGVGTMAAAGGAAGGLMGGPVGMAVGAGIGATGAGAVKFARRNPRTAKWGGAALLTGAASAAIVGGAAAQAYGMHQSPRDTNFGATGDLTLGLHSLRHG